MTIQEFVNHWLKLKQESSALAEDPQVKRYIKIHKEMGGMKEDLASLQISGAQDEVVADAIDLLLDRATDDALQKYISIRCRP